MIVYLDTYTHGGGHEMFNAGLLKMCCDLGEPVVCRASRSSFAAMGRFIKREQVLFHAVPVVGGAGRWSAAARHVLGAVLTAWFLLFMWRNKTVVIPYNNVFALWVINWLCGRRRVIVFCHGELEHLVSRINATGPLTNIVGWLCRRFFLRERHIAAGLRFSVMGERILANLREILPSPIWEHFVTMDHPYFFADAPVEHHHAGILGTCGVMTPAKGLDDFVRFAGLCKGVRLMHVGRVFGDLDRMRAAGIEVPSAECELSRKEYDQLVSEFDFILFFYPSNNYRITASGAIMDSLSLKKPIIALRNDYFEYVFEKFGEFGYLCDTVEDMVTHAKNVPAVDFDTIRKKFSPEALLPQLRAII